RLGTVLRRVGSAPGPATRLLRPNPLMRLRRLRAPHPMLPIMKRLLRNKPPRKATRLPKPRPVAIPPLVRARTNPTCLLPRPVPPKVGGGLCNSSFRIWRPPRQRARKARWLTCRTLPIRPPHVRPPHVRPAHARPAHARPVHAKPAVRPKQALRQRNLLRPRRRLRRRRQLSQQLRARPVVKPLWRSFQAVIPRIPYVEYRHTRGRARQTHAVRTSQSAASDCRQAHAGARAG